jgi:hypothetical protein
MGISCTIFGYSNCHMDIHDISIFHGVYSIWNLYPMKFHIVQIALGPWDWPGTRRGGDVNFAQSGEQGDPSANCPGFGVQPTGWWRTGHPKRCWEISWVNEPAVNNIYSLPDHEPLEFLGTYSESSWLLSHSLLDQTCTVYYSICMYIRIFICDDMFTIITSIIQYHTHVVSPIDLVVFQNIDR